MRAIFLDKDGTLVEDVPYNVNPDLIRLAPRAGEALRSFQQQGYALFVVSNQAGLAKGLFTEAALQTMRQHLCTLLLEQGVTLRGFYYCPHHPDGRIEQYALDCGCRKPMPGMLKLAASEHAIDLRQSWMIGDILDDVEAGRHAGCNTTLINNGNETEWEISDRRMPDLMVPDLYRAAEIIRIFDGTLHSTL